MASKVADPYRWLEDGKSPEVASWLASENKLARSYLDALPGRDALQKRYANCSTSTQFPPLAVPATGFLHETQGHR